MWTACGNFVIDEQTGLIKHWWKDWDKMRSTFRHSPRRAIIDRTYVAKCGSNWAGSGRIMMPLNLCELEAEDCAV